MRTDDRRSRRRRQRREQQNNAGVGMRVALLAYASIASSVGATANYEEEGGSSSSSVVYLDNNDGGGDERNKPSFNELQHRHLEQQQQQRMSSVKPHQQPPQHRQPLHKQHPQRRLANPFLPDYTSKTCKNDKAAEPWQVDSAPKSATECCNMYFSWEKESCEEGSMMGIMKDISTNLSQQEKVEYYPDSSEGICRVVDALMPSWITTIEDDYGICCSQHLSWSLEKCLKARPLPPPPVPSVGMSGTGATAAATKKTPNPTEQSPPAPSPKEADMPSQLMSSQALTDQCSRLIRKQQCNLNEPYCEWVEANNGGGGSCINPNAAASIASSSGGINEYDGYYGGTKTNDGGGSSFGGKGGSSGGGGYANLNSNEGVVQVLVDCDGLKRTDCVKMDGCGWKRKEGCVAEGAGGAASTGTNPNKSSTSNSNPAPRPAPVSAPAADTSCESAESEAQCLMHSTQCRWRPSKKKCSSAPASATSIGANTSPSMNSDVGNKNDKDNDEEPMYVVNGEVVEEWYLDTGDGNCKPNSATRPSWLNQIFNEPQECCAESWDSRGCGNALPKEFTLNDLTSDAAAKNDVGDGLGEAISWYYDSGDGNCKPDSPTRPSWLNDLYDDPMDCCGISYDSQGCVRYVTKLLDRLYADAANNNGDVNNNYGDDANGNDGTSDDGNDKTVLSPEDDPSGSYILIDLTAYGTLQLTLDSLPAKNSPEWNIMKRVLTKTLLLIMVESCKSWVHGDMEELELWYIGTESFTWRRSLQAGSEEKEDKEELVPHSALRGHRRMASETYELKWEMLIPAKCNSSCQNNKSGSQQLAENSPFPQINACFARSVTSGNLDVLLKNIGMNMGLFGQYDEPMASDGELTYRFATKSSDQGLTWQPSPTPTYAPTEVTNSPTLDIYYADSIKNVCTVTDFSFGFNKNKFGSMESCCKFEWMGNYNICMTKSLTASLPSSKPTTAKPTKARRTPKPTKKQRAPRPQQDSRPKNDSATRPVGTGQVTGPTTPGVVFYPDLTLGVCKFDGKHGNTPYQFLSANECCTNQWMDYDKCMAYANPYYSSANAPKYYPDVYEGYCKSDGGHEGLDERLVFRSVEECCDNVWMNEAECLVKSKNPPGPSYPWSPNPPPPTPPPPPTKRPTPNNLAGDSGGNGGVDEDCRWYPDPDAFGICTYSSDYPEHWDTVANRDNYLFDTHDNCCQTAFGGSGCGQKFKCSGSTSGLTSDGIYVSDPPTSMTDYPTFNPTMESGPGPAGRPNDSPSSLNHSAPGTPSSPNPPSPTPPLKTSKPTPQFNGISVTTPNPTVKYIAPPDISMAIDATGITKEIKDGFEDGISGTWPWITTDALPWSLNSKDKTEGKVSAKSHTLKSGEKSDLSVAIQSTHGGIMHFDFKSDVKMPVSGCYVNVDGETKFGYTFPKEDWMPLSLTIPDGEHVVMFRSWAPKLVGGSSTPSDVSSTISVDNVSFIPNLLEDFEGGKLAWGSDLKFEGQNGFWRFDWTTAYRGSVSIRSPSTMKGGESTAMSYEVDAPRGAVLSFWYLSEVEYSLDSFLFKIDGETVLEETETRVEWREYTQEIPAGTHKLSWHYEKHQDSGKGAIRIDDIEFFPE